MVQVIRGSSGLSREEAFNRGIKQAASGLGGVGTEISRREALAQREAERDRARSLQGLQFETGLSKQGIEVSPEEGEAISQAFGAGGDVSGLRSILGKQTEQVVGQRERAAQVASEDRALNRRFKEAQIGQFGVKQQERVKTQKAKDEKLRKEEEALVIPGFGKARTKKEAQTIRDAQADASEAAKIIDKIKEMGTDINLTDRTRINKIDQLKTILAGKMRLPLTGPGAMTESEFQRLITTIGDPADPFSTEAIQKSKLEQLKTVIQEGIKSKISAAVIPDIDEAMKGLGRVASFDAQTKEPTLKKPLNEMSLDEMIQLRGLEEKRLGVGLAR